MGEIKFGKLMIYIAMVIIAVLAVAGFFYYFSYYNQQTKNTGSEKGQIEINKQINKKAGLIKVAEPKPNQIVSSPLAVAGEARGNWYFEASFPVALFDGNGNELARVPAQAQGDWMATDFVPFQAVLIFEAPNTENGTLVLEKDNPSGLPQNADELRIPVRFSAQPIAETIKVYAYFNNSDLDPQFSCNKVFPVEREVVKTEAVAKAALEELLSGPIESEKQQKFFTSINSGVKIQKLTVGNGVAKADFSEQLEFQVGGSCRVAAIRSQITETLKQFPTVKEVIISINGRTEDILQP